jgi:hypothetical protein
MICYQDASKETITRILNRHTHIQTSIFFVLSWHSLRDHIHTQLIMTVTPPTTTTTTTPSTPATHNPDHEEHQYLSLIRQIITHGQPRPDRTGTGTLAMFAPPAMRFSLRGSTFPLLTTKRVFLRGVVEELLWFIRGSTDGNLLSDLGIGIWDGNGSREYLDKVGLKDRRQGDLGPVYGFQWRHFGAEYGTCDDDYRGKGVDQLAQVIEKIRNNPTDRRIILSAWNPKGECERSEREWSERSPSSRSEDYCLA